MRGRTAKRSYRFAGRRPHHHDHCGWRWGELNPRPLLSFWLFYGCSFYKVLLGPGASLKRHIRQAQPQRKSRAALRLNREARFLNDAGTQNEIKSGPTDFRLAYAARVKSVRLALAPIVCSGHLRVDATFTTRFIQLQKQCRNRSSPTIYLSNPLLGSIRIPAGTTFYAVRLL